MSKYICLIALIPIATIFADSSFLNGGMKKERGRTKVPSKIPHAWIDAAFTYWHAKEDGLNAAESAQVMGTGKIVFASDPTIFQQQFGYHPGFKVGLGVSSVDWKLYGVYTYYRGNNHVKRKAPSGSIGTGVWNVDSWYLQSTFLFDQSLAGSLLASKWKIGMDMGDFLLSRPLHRRRAFDYAVFGGLRTVWIRQQMNLELTQDGAPFGGSGFLGPQPLSSHNQSHAWGIGPRLGVDIRYNLPLGFNFDGTIGATLFFTKFTKVRHREAAAATYYEAPHPLQTSYRCARPEMDLSLGFGWGRDAGSKRIDILASYEILYFWGQNMMRYVLDEFSTGISAGSLDLYFQGLTLKIACGF